jgi:hypothetical protein
MSERAGIIIIVLWSAVVLLFAYHEQVRAQSVTMPLKNDPGTECWGIEDGKQVALPCPVLRVCGQNDACVSKVPVPVDDPGQPVLACAWIAKDGRLVKLAACPHQDIGSVPIMNGKPCPTCLSAKP